MQQSVHVNVAAMHSVWYEPSLVYIHVSSQVREGFDNTHPSVIVSEPVISVFCQSCLQIRSSVALHGQHRTSTHTT